MEISVTIIIIIATGLVSVMAFSNRKLMEQFIFYPPAIARGQWYRFFSSGLIHADFGHLIFNMLALYLFGELVEAYYILAFGVAGRIIYLVMYVIAIGAASIPTYTKHKDNYHYRSLGASGAVSAVIFTGILFQPLTGIGLFFIPIYIAGFLFGILFLVVSGWLDKRGQGNINHSAHLFGALFGMGFTIIACRIFSDYPVLQEFIDQIKTMDPSEIIQFGR